MDPRISRLIDSLPTLTKDDVEIHDYCPICFVDFKTLLDGDSEVGAEPAGITRLEGCSHVFCKKDLIQWIQTWHGSCPTCRNIFLSDLHPDSESDDESDGGEYDPSDSEHQDDDEDEEESFEAEPEELEDPEAFGDEEEFEEEDDHAMGLEITDPDDFDSDLSLEAAAARQEAYVEEQLQAAEAAAARIEAELQGEEEEGFGVEEFFYEDALGEDEGFVQREFSNEEEEEAHQAEYFLGEEAEGCTDPPDWDIDVEEVGFSIADFQPENEIPEEDIHEEVGDEVDLDFYEEFDQR